ncbi:3-oxoacid CoA-transferase subunit A [Plastoroseomonas hellenica]|uniref:3-oxoacid CoA-transferase subunit A n=1 Tax=Plastoroseomonas hellenica TaxID=2687306 RepID=UPI001BA95E23|nr:3-oxoacid CoA-transferase subunit A [Plastoroseomonas hellenica]MBR0646112.1 3-oxoacid CoA-transferase subunit A [Plastoroseomonas hellenica]
MRNVVVGTEAAAVAGLRNGHVVMVGGFGGAGLPRSIIKAVAELGVRDLTVISNNAGAGGDDLSLWFRQRMVRKIICSYPRSAKDFTLQYRAGTVELELLPQGTLVERIRAGGAGLGGFLSPVGVGTVFERGKEKITVGGRDFLLELPLRADFALVKGRTADTLGNVTYNKAARNHCAVMATAADIVAVEVDRIVEAGGLDPESIVTPCIFVDRVFARAAA